MIHSGKEGEEARRQETGGGLDLTTTVYGELRRLAAARMARERTPQTLQATALVHEAWLRMGGDSQPAWINRAHYFSAAAEAMRRILIDRARSRRALRHGGSWYRIDLEAGNCDFVDSISCEKDDEELIALHEALDHFEAHYHQAATLIKLRYFVGMTVEEAAEVLELSKSTAERRLAFARAWLAREMERIREA
ncbi:MAG TPA: ECF-type sigma factor [Oceanipulchritudo sp.]|nr:ECF-type sigma factor [Oceanipulchritudo sp.]